MTDLLTLSQCVEEAAGPSRELDVGIALAIDWRHPSMMGSLHDLLRMGMSVADIVKDAESPQMITSRLPRYTASIDAAASLVPQDRRIGLVQQADPTVWEVCLFTVGDDDSDCPIVSAATPALALCAAALRARSSQENG